jgi:hypothetical protein
VHRHARAERDARDVRLIDPDCSEEVGDLVGVALGRVRPGGLSLSPEPGRSIAMQRKCSVYAGSWNA